MKDLAAGSTLGSNGGPSFTVISPPFQRVTFTVYQSQDADTITRVEEEWAIRLERISCRDGTVCVCVCVWVWVWVLEGKAGRILCS